MRSVRHSRLTHTHTRARRRQKIKLHYSSNAHKFYYSHELCCLSKASLAYISFEIIQSAYNDFRQCRGGGEYSWSLLKSPQMHNAPTPEPTALTDTKRAGNAKDRLMAAFLAQMGRYTFQIYTFYTARASQVNNKRRTMT